MYSQYGKINPDRTNRTLTWSGAEVLADSESQLIPIMLSEQNYMNYTKPVAYGSSHYFFTVSIIKKY